VAGYKIVKDRDLSYITFDIFERTGLVKHAFTTRLGGISRDCFSGLNLAAHVGDDPGAVLENRLRVLSALGCGVEDLVVGQQVHGDHVHTVLEADRGRGGRDFSGAVADTDALITNLPGIMLSSYYADCVPVMILDPVRKAVGLAHAGWKGTVKRIAAATLQSMAAAYGTDPGHCLAVIGPSIGPCCYEIDQPVISAFTGVGFDRDAITRPAGDGRWRLDLWEANKITLAGAGIKTGNIMTAGLCTACSPGLFFSYRGQSGKCGRMASLIMLK
jgi:YfiH family protein